jgi:hypothetical protein
MKPVNAIINPMTMVIDITLIIFITFFASIYITLNLIRRTKCEKLYKEIHSTNDYASANTPYDDQSFSLHLSRHS